MQSPHLFVNFDVMVAMLPIKVKAAHHFKGQNVKTPRRTQNIETEINALPRKTGAGDDHNTIKTAFIMH